MPFFIRKGTSFALEAMNPSRSNDNPTDSVALPKLDSLWALEEAFVEAGLEDLQEEKLG